MSEASNVRIEMGNEMQGRIFINDVEVPKVTRIQFEAGVGVPAKVRIEFYASKCTVTGSMEVEKAPITKLPLIPGSVEL